MTLLKPAQMSKVAVIGLKRNLAKVTSLLHDMGVIQIENISNELAAVTSEGQSGELFKRVSEEVLRLRGLKSALPAVGVTSKTRFRDVGELLEACSSLKIDSEVAALLEKKESVQSEIQRLESSMQIVGELSFLNEDLSVFSLGSATGFVGVGEAKWLRDFEQRLESKIKPVFKAVNAEGEAVTAVVVIRSQDLDLFGSVIQETHLRFKRIPELKGSPTQAKSEMESMLVKAKSTLAEVEASLKAVSEKYYGSISAMEEQLAIESKKLEVMAKFGFTDSLVVFEGWVPRMRLEELKATLSKATAGTTFVYETDSAEAPPTLFQNPKKISLFESFVRFYSLPQADEIDPTMIYSIFFPFFFGFMIGDVGYGLLILLIAIWIRRRVTKGGNSVVPAFIRNFGRTILRPSAWLKVANAMIVGSVVAILFGFLFNEYFGFGFNQYVFGPVSAALGLKGVGSRLVIDPISTYGLKKLLLFSGYTGLFLVCFGFALGAVNSYWERNYRHVLSKIGWLAIALSIAMYGLLLLHGGRTNPVSNPVAGGYIAGVVVGLGLVIYGEGGGAIIEFPSVISHIISYTRLVGILLASVILAHVIDVVFQGTLASGAAIAAFGVVILVLGQAFNLVLGMFEPAIQGARLLYVEFFSKFYHGNGRPFRPFGSRRVFTLPEEASAPSG